MGTDYNARLQRFAAYLLKIRDTPEEGPFGTMEIYLPNNEEYETYSLRYHKWVFWELPFCFSEWEFRGIYGNPIDKGSDPEDTTTSAVVYFFNIMGDGEFDHLFGINSQDLKKYGGRVLTEKSVAADIGRNIIEFVKMKNRLS